MTRSQPWVLWLEGEQDVPDLLSGIKPAVYRLCPCSPSIALCGCSKSRTIPAGITQLAYKDLKLSLLAVSQNMLDVPQFKIELWL